MTLRVNFFVVSVDICLMTFFHYANRDLSVLNGVLACHHDR
jgi:hypothetical protein